MQALQYLICATDGAIDVDYVLNKSASGLSEEEATQLQSEFLHELRAWHARKLLEDLD